MWQFFFCWNLDLCSPLQSETVKNFGTVFDTSLSLEKQVTAVCKAGFYHLRNIARVRKRLSFESNQVLLHAFVTSKLDYCNSLYYGLPDFLIKKLQYVQNSAACLLTGSCKYDHVTPVLKKLHWLPVQHRIIFKILTLTYKYGRATVLKRSSATLCPTAKPPFVCPEIQPQDLWCKSVLHLSPHSLEPIAKQHKTVEMFKSGVKTFLFKQAF